MSVPHYKSIVIKVGTNVLTTEDGLLNANVIRELAGQMSSLLKKGMKIILVSSGAMGAGRSLIKPSSKLGRVSKRQVLAAVGQVRLIETYAKFFAKEDVVCAQVLATKEDFHDRHHYLNMRTCFEALLTENILPIVNENDVVSVDELMFSDNDELAGLIASMMDTDALILLTNVDGVYNGDPHDPASNVIEEMPAEETHWKQFIQPHMSTFGRGGMLTKCMNAHKLSQLGVTTHICNGLAKDILTRVCADERIGTTFPAATSRSLSGTKRWMAGGVSRAKGTVTINEGARNVIMSKEKIASLLPVGIVKVEGDFEKGDIIRIKDEKGNDVGLGVASYNVDRTREFIGKKGQKALVHYDQLYLSNT